MSKKPKYTFIEMCLRGEALLDEIEDYVGEWHDKGGLGLELHEFLGMDEHEYALWMRDESVLPYIVTARLNGKPLSEVLEEEDHLLIAAGSQQGGAGKLLKWLKQQSRLD
ncbi:MAG: hypothetical protein P4L55_03575 [Syntrophobacteraceae bacterium]|nr:hypothetical protein [Syntrophobacteraceae bacterium]